MIYDLRFAMNAQATNFNSAPIWRAELHESLADWDILNSQSSSLRNKTIHPQ